MSDTSETTPTSEAKVFEIELKGGVGKVTVDPAKIVDMDVYEYIFITGLKTVINSLGMSKIASGITKKTGAAKDEAVKAVMEQAQKTIQAMYDGDLKGAKATTKRSGAVQTEAMRLAKALVKQTLKDNGYKVGAFGAKEITAYAKEILKANPGLYKKAEENLAERAALPVKGLDVGALLGDKKDNPDLKAKPKVPPKAKPKADKVVAAAAAGKVPPARQKPQPTAH
jgi:hypothetical protein